MSKLCENPAQVFFLIANSTQAKQKPKQSTSMTTTTFVASMKTDFERLREIENGFGGIKWEKTELTESIMQAIGTTDCAVEDYMEFFGCEKVQFWLLNDATVFCSSAETTKEAIEEEIVMAANFGIHVHLLVMKSPILVQLSTKFMLSCASRGRNEKLQYTTYITNSAEVVHTMCFPKVDCPGFSVCLTTSSGISGVAFYDVKQQEGRILHRTCIIPENHKFLCIQEEFIKRSERNANMWQASKKDLEFLSEIGRAKRDGIMDMADHSKDSERITWMQQGVAYLTMVCRNSRLLVYFDMLGSNTVRFWNLTKKEGTSQWTDYSDYKVAFGDDESDDTKPKGSVSKLYHEIEENGGSFSILSNSETEVLSDTIVLELQQTGKNIKLYKVEMANPWMVFTKQSTPATTKETPSEFSDLTVCCLD